MKFFFAGVSATFAVLCFAGWMSVTSLETRLKDCEAYERTRLAGVAIECRVIKP